LQLSRLLLSRQTADLLHVLQSEQATYTREREVYFHPSLARDNLILHYLPKVRMIASRIHRRLPANISLDDLISAGVLGLIAAVDGFDPSQGVRLNTYAEYKIRGAILDSLRDLDWAPRDARKQARQIERASSAVEQRWKRAPTEDEVAAELGVDIKKYRSWLVRIRDLDIRSLEYRSAEQKWQSLLEFIPDSNERLPSVMFERGETKRLLTDAMAQLRSNERLVLSMYFEEGLTLREIGEFMGVHQTRVSQIKSQAILHLRIHLAEHWPDCADQVQELALQSKTTEAV
jgi:RNA polymerase sigma factor for flagellar operon FliA